jgi:hypothetical protein
MEDVDPIDERRVMKIGKEGLVAGGGWSMTAGQG